MTTVKLGFGARLGMAIKVLFNAAFANALHAAAEDAAGAGQERTPAQLAEAGADEASPSGAAAEAAEPQAPAPDLAPGALHMLALLQREGRFVDFLQEDISGFSDEEVGGAARVVHEGCSKSLKQYVVLAPLRGEPEGGPLTVDKGFNPDEFRLTGDVKGEPPYLGMLAHPGWRAVEVKLPEVQADHDASIVAPAEVEL